MNQIVHESWDVWSEYRWRYQWQTGEYAEWYNLKEEKSGFLKYVMQIF